MAKALLQSWFFFNLVYWTKIIIREIKNLAFVYPKSRCLLFRLIFHILSVVIITKKFINSKRNFESEMAKKILFWLKWYIILLFKKCEYVLKYKQLKTRLKKSNINLNLKSYD